MLVISFFFAVTFCMTHLTPFDLAKKKERYYIDYFFCVKCAPILPSLADIHHSQPTDTTTATEVTDMDNKIEHVYRH